MPTERTEEVGGPGVSGGCPAWAVSAESWCAQGLQINQSQHGAPGISNEPEVLTWHVMGVLLG